MLRMTRDVCALAWGSDLCEANKETLNEKSDVAREVTLSWFRQGPIPTVVSQMRSQITRSPAVAEMCLLEHICSTSSQVVSSQVISGTSTVGLGAKFR